MALLQSSSNTKMNSDFTGYFEAGIEKVEDKSGQYDWADCWLDVHFKIKNSKYPQVHSIKGSYERNPDGTVSINRVVRQFNYLKDAIGFEGGINTEGDWEMANGEKIDNIESTLNNYISEMNGSDNPLLEPPHNYLIYVYREAPKKQGDKTYKRVLGKIVDNDNAGRSDLESYVTYMKQKGYLKEASENDTPSAPTQPQSDMPF
jgi:hypothetical protein